MKWFGIGKAKKEGIQPPPQAVKCSHPVSYQVALNEDPTKPLVPTGWKCTNCGERMTAPPRPGGKST
jgi:hypothetical protein